MSNSNTEYNKIKKKENNNKLEKHLRRIIKHSASNNSIPLEIFSS